MLQKFKAIWRLLKADSYILYTSGDGCNADFCCDVDDLFQLNKQMQELLDESDPELLQQIETAERLAALN